MTQRTMLVCGLVLAVLLVSSSQAACSAVQPQTTASTGKRNKAIYKTNASNKSKVKVATGSVSSASPVDNLPIAVLQQSSTSRVSRGSSSTSSGTSSGISGGTNSISNSGAITATADTMPAIPWKRIIPLSLVLPWLYFVCGAMNIPTLPRYVNFAISEGTATAGNMQVSSKGAEVYGNINGIDSFFTFLSVNLIGVLSDRFGRKMFMMLASLGLAMSHLCMSFATTPMHFYISSVIDGLSSCMLSQSQAYIADILCLQARFPPSENTSQATRTTETVATKKNPVALGIALSRFQGVCIGVAYLIGIPLGAKIAKTFSYRSPLQVSAALGVTNVLLLGLFLPNLQKYMNIMAQQDADRDSTQENHGNKKINWSLANPFGAIYLFRRSPQLFVGGLVYFLINFAHSSLQVNWINYLQYRYGWSATLSGSTLMIVGLVVAILPSIFVPLVGKLPAIKYSLLIHSMISIFLGWNKHPYGIFLTMPVLAAGASAMPMILGYLTEQVPNHEVGNLQGAADTLRTISAVIAAPLSAKIFSMYLGLASAPKDAWYRPLCERFGPGIALYFTAVFSFIGYVIFNFIQALPSDNPTTSLASHELKEESEDKQQQASS